MPEMTVADHPTNNNNNNQHLFVIKDNNNNFVKTTDRVPGALGITAKMLSVQLGTEPNFAFIVIDQAISEPLASQHLNSYDGLASQMPITGSLITQIYVTNIFATRIPPIIFPKQSLKL